MTTYDAIVVGAGPNGLVAANTLADAGWSVLVLEAQDEVGGAVRSAQDVHPGYVHDTFSAFYPLAVASPAIQRLDLESYGVEWCRAPAVLGHPFPDGQWAMLHQDRDLTARLMEEQCPGDGDAWLELCREWDAVGSSLLHALIHPFPPVRHGVSTLVRLLRAGGLPYLKDMVSPVADFTHARFGGRSPKVLLAGTAGHSDIPPNAPGSAAFGLLMTMLGQTVGFPVPKGGAGALSQAMARRLMERGGEIRCSAEVTGIEVRDRRARGVQLADGDRVACRHGVLADVVAPHLYGRLLDPDDVPARKKRGMTRFRFDPSTVKVDWALDGDIPWESPPPVPLGALHVADSLDDMAVAMAQVATGAVPERPFLLAGSMTSCDATRSPAGTQSVWAYTHVPQHVAHDAGDGVRGTWDDADLQRFADRVQARFERLAPGFGDRVLARRVLGPRELEERDANLVGGAINGGTAQLHQEVVLRPTPGLGRAETGIRGVYLASASAHPGGGVHGGPGYNAARAALAHARVRRLVTGPLGRCGSE